MHPLHRPIGRTTLAVGAVVVMLSGIAACGDGGDTVAVDPTTPTTPTTADATVSLGTFSEDYCERAEQLSSTGALRLDENPGRAAAAMETLGAAAPPGLTDDFDVVTEQLRSVGGLGTSDPSDALELLDLLLDEDFLAALDRIERATLEQCDVRLGAGADDEAGD